MTIGLTGGIGSGKSTVAKVLESMGYPVFYSDKEGKDLMVNDAQLRSDIVAHFGDQAYENGQLNRAYLAGRIFKNPEDKAQLNHLIHPRVRAKFQEFADQSKAKLVFNEAAILFETGAHKGFDAMLLVVAPKEERIERVMKRDASSREDVLNRMNNQWDDDRKVELADWVINNGDTDKVLVQIESIVEKMLHHSTSS